MTYSPLTNKYIPADTSNYSQGRSGQKVVKFTPHHMAGNLTIETCGGLWQTKGRKASSNYGIGTDGRIACYVQEENRAWTSSSAANDNQAITVEVANDGGAPDWHVSDKAIESLINLMVDVFKRYGIKSANYTGNANGNVTLHQFFTSTACPGPYLKSKMPWIAEQVNKRLQESEKPKLTWTKLDKPEVWKTNLRPTNLWDFNHTSFSACKSVKQFGIGEEITIYGKVYNESLKSTYFLTEYSFTRQIANGFNQVDMVKKEEPKPEPQPEPTPEPEPEPEPTPEDPTVGILQKIIDFIKHIIDLITEKK